MDMSGGTQRCSGDFSGISLYPAITSTMKSHTHRKDRDANVCPTTHLSEDNSYSGAAPVPLGPVCPHCHLGMHFLRFVCSHENSISECTPLLLPCKKAAPAAMAQPYLPENSFWYVTKYVSQMSIRDQEKSRRGSICGEETHVVAGRMGLQAVGKQGLALARGESLLRLLVLPPAGA